MLLYFFYFNMPDNQNFKLISEGNCATHTGASKMISGIPSSGILTNCLSSDILCWTVQITSESKLAIKLLMCCTACLRSLAFPTPTEAVKPMI